MNLVATLVVRNELHRYLPACVEHLREFCDEIVVVDDASDDGTTEWLMDAGGKTRDRLLATAMRYRPTHIIPLDADELVADGPALRALIEETPTRQVWHLPIREVWQADRERYFTREDGGWPRGRTLAWRVPNGRLSFPDRALACGRVPEQIARIGPQQTHIPLLHLGWLDETERAARVARYTEHDGGRFHARTHLASILAPADQVTLAGHAWPPSLEPWLDSILEHAKMPA